MSPQPGEVWLADLGLAAKTRPVVIVSRSDSDPPRALAIYVPLTIQNRHSNYEVVFPKRPFLHELSIANVQGIASIPAVRLERKLGKVPPSVMDQIRQALRFALGFLERVAIHGGASCVASGPPESCCGSIGEPLELKNLELLRVH